jgi:hypothetical protein
MPAPTYTSDVVWSITERAAKPATSVIVPARM